MQCFFSGYAWDNALLNLKCILDFLNKALRKCLSFVDALRTSPLLSCFLFLMLSIVPSHALIKIPGPRAWLTIVPLVPCHGARPVPEFACIKIVTPDKF